MRMIKVAIIDKAPSRNKYANHFNFEFDEYHLSSIPLTKVLKKDVDININIDNYDFVILVGSEAAKYFAKATVSSTSGVLLFDKFLCCPNPAMLIFRPEGKPDFERTVKKIHEYVSGVVKDASKCGTFIGITEETEAINYLNEVLEHGDTYVAWDTETTSLYPRDGYVLGISISYKVKDGRYISSDCITDEVVLLLQKVADKFETIFHNLKFDWKMIEYHFSIKFDPERVHDTMVEHYILDETAGSHGLKTLAIKFTDYGDYDSELDDFKKEYCKSKGILEEDFTYDLIPWDVISKYAAIDTAVTLELHLKFYPIIMAHPKLSKLYKELMMPSIVFLTKMEEVGIPLDKERMLTSAQYLNDSLLEAKTALYDFDEIKNFESIKGSIFNPSSVVQLRSLLFDYVKLTPTGKLTKGGAVSTDAEVLEELKDQHPIPAHILKIRQLSKIKSSYLDKIIPAMDRDNRIRTNFNLTFTTSGRLSSSGKFNAQQIPRDDPIIKGCIKAPDGFKIIQQDLATAEMYYAAVLSKDKDLQQVFINKGDFHSSIAKMVFDLGCAVEDVKKLHPVQRQAAKAVE